MGTRPLEPTALPNTQIYPRVKGWTQLDWCGGHVRRSSQILPAAPVRKVQWLCYQDHIVKFRQDIAEIATQLPRLPARIDIVVTKGTLISAGILLHGAPGKVKARLVV